MVASSVTIILALLQLSAARLLGSPSTTGENGGTNGNIIELQAHTNDVAGCLLVKDDNSHLSEWIAYHYHALPLRQLVIAVDPSSETSPETIIGRWNSIAQLDIDIQLWKEEDYRDIDTIAADLELKYQAELEDDIDTLTELHNGRQMDFVSQCLLHHKERKGSWVALVDTDEFIAFNSESETGTSTKKAIVALENQPFPCVGMTRTLFGPKIVNKAVEGHEVKAFSLQDQIGMDKFSTSKYFYHDAYGEKSFNGYQKVFINVRHVTVQELKMSRFASIHRPLESICPDIDQFFSTKADVESLFRVHHYLGSWDDYNFRQDARRSYEVYSAKATAANRFGPNFALQNWTVDFAGDVGISLFRELLSPVPSQDDTLVETSLDSDGEWMASANAYSIVRRGEEGTMAVQEMKAGRQDTLATISSRRVLERQEQASGAPPRDKKKMHQPGKRDHKATKAPTPERRELKPRGQPGLQATKTPSTSKKSKSKKQSGKTGRQATKAPTGTRRELKPRGQPGLRATKAPTSKTKKVKQPGKTGQEAKKAPTGARRGLNPGGQAGRQASKAPTGDAKKLKKPEKPGHKVANAKTPENRRDLTSVQGVAYLLPEVRRQGDLDEVKHMIPNELHFVYLSQGLRPDQPELPKRVVDTIAAWQETLGPSWNIHVWNNSMVLEEFQDIAHTLQQIDIMAWVSDLVRILILEKFGGIYLDSDIAPLGKTLEPLLQLENFTVCEIPKESRGFIMEDAMTECNQMNNAVIGSTKNNPVLEAMIELSLQRTYAKLDANMPLERYEILEIAGPKTWSAVLKAADASFNVLHPFTFYPCKYEDRHVCSDLTPLLAKEQDSFGVHQWSGSWQPDEYFVDQDLARDTIKKNGLYHWALGSVRWDANDTPFQYHQNVDVISVGTRTRPDLQSMQQRLLESNPAIRSFFPVTEADDEESGCAENLSQDSVWEIAEFCHDPNRLEELRSEGKHVQVGLRTTAWKFDWITPGWMCAQKRPMSGMMKYFMDLSPSEGLPDYLWLLDDDTYTDVDAVLGNLERDQESLTWGGCMIQFEQQHHGMEFDIPWGGLGTYLGRMALEQLLTPIHCPNTAPMPLPEGSNTVAAHLAALRGASEFAFQEEFLDNACQQLERNEFGESAIFQQGMTLLELMHEYTFFQPFQDYKKWTHGSCFHSDFIWSSFFQPYLTSPYQDDNWPENNHMSPYEGSVIKEYDLLHGGPPLGSGQCQFGDKRCQSDSHICHHLSADEMLEEHMKRS